MGERGVCTLLGPEGPDVGAHLFLLDLFWFPVLSGGWFGDRPYFENYTVDASIFDMTFGLCRFDDLKDH